MLLATSGVIRFLTASVISATLFVRLILGIKNCRHTTWDIHLEGLRGIERKIEVVSSAFMLFVACKALPRRRWSTWASISCIKEHPSSEDSLGTSGIVWWWLIIIVATSEPTVASLVLDIEIAILYYDQIHVLPDADGHEDEGVAHELTNPVILRSHSSECVEDWVSIHHAEECVACVAETVIVICIVPKDWHGQKHVANKDRSYSSHNFDVHWHSHFKCSGDDAVRPRKGKVLHARQPIDCTSKSYQHFNLRQFEPRCQYVK